MPHSYWFGGLAVLALALLGYTLWKSRDGRLLVLHFCLGGLIDPLEYFILILFPSYQYFSAATGALWMDNLLGSICSNDFIVPAVAVAAAAFRLRVGWLLLLSVLFMAVEWLFLRLDLYGHFWWKTVYTGIGIFLLLLAGKWIWGVIQRGATTVPFLFFYVFFVFLFVYGSCHIVQAHLLDVHDIRTGWFPDPLRDHIAVEELIETFAAVIAAVAYFVRTPGKVAVLTLLLALDAALLARKIIQVDNAEELLFYVLLQLVSIFAVHAAVKYGTRRAVP